ncbi:Cation-transporting P-type ATPase, subfamily V domain-containing protein [Rozella allomycis CSF55]|uniref:Cation-transporting ATPase n=1 Tax=Rozella allomycis (strain CSF55) TaxID=988480 RepID=A0A075AT83_ROZAC|nr:Cation-transporting P-type ATPase, subfamily V domain-containing protein [Rozella allomycis CSF55]|eukprot:EPZ31935.1 Cation-transporting P-type ATPase, subfamily V domain-containing protein [Rozella allomycis CSF55]
MEVELDEEIVIHVKPLREIAWRKYFVSIVSIFSFGLLYLCCRWMPRVYAYLLCKESSVYDATKCLVINNHGESSIVEKNGSSFTYHCYKVIFNEMTGEFQPIKKIIQEMNFGGNGLAWKQIESLKDVYEENVIKVPIKSTIRIFIDEIESLKDVYEENVIKVPIKSTIRIFIDEVLHPFNVFQIFSIILWSLDNYYLYAGCVLIISLISSMMALFETRRNLRALNKLNNEVCLVECVRDNKTFKISSNLLFPGDLFLIPNQRIEIPCDCVLIEGNCLINESSLTGESIPVSKQGNPQINFNRINKNYHHQLNSKSVMFGGTRVLKASSNAKAVVLSTGFETVKGTLIRSMIYPKPHGFKFYRDAFRFVGILALIAMIGFCFSLYFFIIKKANAYLIIKRAFDLFTIVVPPALPSTLLIGTSFAISRLKKKEIYCISPSKINIGGKLNLFIFDKTGTLTEPDMDVYGILMNQEGEKIFKDSMSQPQSIFGMSMACCHSLNLDQNKIIGDQLEEKMFEFSQWRFDGSTRVSYGNKKIEILKINDFNSNLRRMSVVCKCEAEVYGFVKGSPEEMMRICKNVPDWYETEMNKFTRKGFRVLSVGFKRLKEENLNSRNQIEKDLEFLGFLIFENKIKKETFKVISELNKASCKNIICTGDNLLTACSISRQCKIIPQEDTIFISKISNNFIEWISLDDPSISLDLKNFSSFKSNYTLACTGKVFDLLSNSSLLDKVLIKCKIFARFSPDQKQKLVDHYQQLGYYVSFCGDGANDCGALRQADVGISLSNSEACVAASFTSKIPNISCVLEIVKQEACVAASFTSKIPNISCVLEIVKQGRAALVTSFSCFKYMALYSIIQFTSVILLYTQMASLADPQYLYIDLFIVFPLTLTMGRFNSNTKISKKRPTANILSPKVLVSLIGHILIQIIFQIYTYFTVIHHHSFTLTPILENDTNSFNLLTSSIFIFTIFQYVTLVDVFIVGAPFQEIKFKKPPDLRLYILTLTIICSLISKLCEKFVFPVIAKVIKNISSFTLLDVEQDPLIDHESEWRDKKKYKRLEKLLSSGLR